VDFLIHHQRRAKYCSAKCAQGWSRGAGNPAWKGGRLVVNGYVEIYAPNHPMANRAGKVKEHRLVMEQMIGRPLLKTESVHHKNGIRHDNRPENLELWARVQPSGQRVSDMIEYIVANHRESLLRRLDGE
jgi:hypothetical protein